MGSSKASPMASQTQGRKTRVRTGCLTCRSRKVKCDEARPFCYNCTRLNKACLYQSPLLSDFCAASSRLAGQASTLGRSQEEFDFGDCQETLGDDASNGASRHSGYNGDLLPGTEWFNANLELGEAPLDFVTGEWGDLFPATSDCFHIPDASQERTPGSAALLRDEISPAEPSSFSYFLSSVEPPFITPWDASNWDTIKVYACHLARSEPAVGAAVTAVEVLYEGLLDNEDTAAALSKYFVAKSAHLALLKGKTSDMEAILITTLLLCCFEVVAQHETVPSTLKQKDLLVDRLEQRETQQTWSPVSRRIICWLHLFHTKAMHLGGRGMLSPRLLELLPEQQPPLSLFSLQQSQTPPIDPVASDLKESLFQFYCELQRISVKVSGLNRHHRPRGGPEDERKVEQLSDEIERRLSFLWQGRPWVLDAATDVAHHHTSCSPATLEHVRPLAILCKISYYAEVIYCGRGSGTSAFGSYRLNSARAIIKSSVSTAMAESPRDELGPAFIWPLFLYIVESTDRDGATWGLQALNQILSPWWNITAVKELIASLSEQQLSTGARVDSRYFCVERFGTVPPFM